MVSPPRTTNNTTNNNNTTGAISLSPAISEYVSARSRTASMESSGGGHSRPSTSTSRRQQQNEPLASSSSSSSVELLAPLSGDRAIAVSRSIKRQFKDRRIYVNQRTGLPIRPPTSFGLFKHALRRSLKKAKVSFDDFNRRAQEQWSGMSELDKEVYVRRSRELTDQYKKIEVRFLRQKVRQIISGGRYHHQSQHRRSAA